MRIATSSRSAAVERSAASVISASAASICSCRNVDLAADLLEPLGARPQLLIGRGQIVREHLELGADLAQSHVGLASRVDHRRTDEHALGRHERRLGMLGLLARGLVDVAAR